MKMKTQGTEWEIISVKHISDKKLFFDKKLMSTIYQ